MRADILAVDPGTTQSAFVIASRALQGLQILEHGIAENADLLRTIREHADAQHMAIEMVASYGMPVGREVFETCVWIGRFIEAWQRAHSFVYRRDVKLHVCGSPRANDATIRQALIDRLGAPGTKRAPGATYGIKADAWQALAVAVTWLDRNTEGEAAPWEQ